MNTNRKTFVLIFTNILLLSFFGIGLAFQYIQPLYENDISRLTYLISGLMGVNIVLSIFDSYWTNGESFIERYLHFFKRNVLFLGLLGTVIGLSVVINALHLSGNGSVTDQINEMIQIMSISLKTSFNSTMFGIGALLWTNILVYIAEEV